MDELKQILREQAARYPGMQPTDAVKLIYQNEFGGGHMIQDKDACLAYLRKEYAATERNRAIPRSEYIGNGISRVNLAALPPEELEALGNDFIRSAAGHTGTMDRFLAKLSVLMQLVEEGVFSFGAAEMASYLEEYAKRGCPAVSHSEVYRRLYHPAYRVVKK